MLGFIGLALLLAACGGSSLQTTLEPRGPIARDIDGLWRLVFIIAVVVFVLVQAALLYAVWKFRERPDDDREPRQVHGNTRLEVIWTIIPAVILAVITVPTVQGIFSMRAIPTDPDTIQIQVTGHQWWWEFEYMEGENAAGGAMFTANELHIPTGVPVYLTMSSGDVIHSFWVPPLNGKRDVVPTRVSNLTLEADPEVATTDYGLGPGVILGQCAEFCGLAHADMRVRVFVHTPEDYEAWLASQTAPAVVPESGPLADGFTTFNAVCTACHAATVQLSDGTIETVGPEDYYLEVGEERIHSALAPDLTHFGSRTTFAGASLDNLSEHLAAWIDNPSDLKPMDPDRNDIPTRRILGMPDFGLSAEEIDNMVALLESWGR